MEGEQRPYARPLAAAALAALLLGAALVAAVTVAASRASGPAPAASVAEPRREQPLATRVERAPLRTITLAATGDIALAGSPAPTNLFAGVGNALRAGVSLGNLEGTLATGGASKCGSRTGDGCYAFRASPDHAARLRGAGFDVLNLANNHAYDFGPAGQAETLAALRGARLRHTGRPGEIAIVKAHGVRVALLGFAPYPWAQSLLDLDAAARLVRRAAAHADVVVVTMHAGAEGSDRAHVRPGAESYLGEPRGDVVAFARTVVAAGADLVVGHGPHVLRGVEWYRGRLIAYSLGNFAGSQTLAVEGVLGASAVLRVRLRADGSWEDGRLVPVRLVGTGTPTLDPSRTALELVRSLSREDFGASAVRVAADGRLSPPGSRASAAGPSRSGRIAAPAVRR